jgi:hypothetical protein
VNQLYQITMSELEAMLPPRVVSQSLQQGLKQVDETSDSVDYKGLEKVLKSQIYRQLQAKMPKEQAKDKIKDILTLLEDSGNVPEAPAEPEVDPLEAQGEAIAELKEAMRPYNLYFEWSETQKLRAQLQLLEEAQQAGNEATSLLNDAKAQLRAVEQKLEDQLVEQNRQLNELIDALDAVREVGGSKVRRLDNRLKQIQGAQDSRQLASAEIERARKLLSDLRKAADSAASETSAVSKTSAASETAAQAAAEADDDLLDIELDDAFDDAPAAAAEEEVLLEVEATPLAQTEEEDDDELVLDMSVETSADSSNQIDIDGEHYELDGLAREYSNLLNYDEALAQQVADYRSRLESGTSIRTELASLRDQLATGRDEWRERLKAELIDMQGHLADFEGETELMELELSVKVTLEVLETTLPAVGDINQARQLFRLLRDRNAGRSEAEAEAREAERAKLERQVSIIEQLRGVHSAASDVAPEQKRALEQSLVALEQAQADARVANDLVDEARQAAQALNDAIAEQAQGEGERQQAVLRKLLNQVQALPPLAATQEQQQAVMGELTNQLSALPDTPFDDAQMRATEAMVEHMHQEVREHYQARLQMLTEQAAMLGERQLLQRLNDANNGFEQQSYADLDELERALKQAGDTRRSEQINEVHQLENEMQAFARVDNDSTRELRALIADANERLEQGQLVDNLERGWLLLENLNQQISQQAASFIPRLNRALDAFEPLARLQTDDTATVRRILRHLDAQRDAYERVSTAMKEQLDASLSQAEDIIKTLQEEYEATRAVAQELVSGSFLDDMLGVLGGDSTPSAPVTPEPGVTSDIVDMQSEYPPLNAWLEDYLAEADISSAALFAGNEMLGGTLRLNPQLMTSSLESLSGHLASLGDELNLGHMNYVTVETHQGIMVAAWPDPKHVFVVVVDTPANLSLVLGKLRRGLGSLADILDNAPLAR